MTDAPPSFDQLASAHFAALDAERRAVQQRAAQLMAESDLLNAQAALSRLRLAARAVVNTRPHPTDPVLLRRVEALRRELGDR